MADYSIQLEGELQTSYESPVKPQGPPKADTKGPETFKEWLETCVWLPFLVSLALWIAYAQVLPEHTTPNTSFVDHYNPQQRDDITFPGQSSTIDFAGMVLFFSIMWFVVALISEIILPWNCTRNRSVLFYHFLTLTLAFTEATFLTNATTDFIKFRIGALRPDFFVRCFGKNYTGPVPSSLAGIEACPSGDLEKIKEGMVSFPSGHTSIGIGMGLFITLYLVWCLYLRNRKHLIAWLHSFVLNTTSAHFWTELMIQAMFFVALTPVLLGYAVAMTRLLDFRHHFVDVLMGMLLGTFFSVIVMARSIRFFRE